MDEKVETIADIEQQIAREAMEAPEDDFLKEVAEKASKD